MVPAKGVRFSPPQPRGVDFGVTTRRKTSNEKSRKGDHYLRISDLEPFVRKVNVLRLEGLTTRDIAERLGVSVSTMNGRLRKHRVAQVS